MKKTLILLFISIFTITFSQTKKEAEIKELFWGDKDPIKTSTTIPEKWNNESAVIIYKDIIHDYHKFGKSITYTSSIRKRIKLLDKAAVESFSEFSFNKNFWSRRGFSWRKGGQFIAIKIIKPSGEEFEINIDDEAIEADNGKKLALANLEVGDILDYYLYKIEPFKSRDEYGFSAVETTLGEEYPIVNMRLTLNTENDFFINFQTYNGAPELVEIPTGKRGVRHYELNASNVAKDFYPRWFYPLAEIPSYKFQVFFARSGKFENRAIAFLSEKEDIIKKKVDIQDVINLYDNKFKPNGDIGDIKKYFKDKNITSNKDIVTEGYYFMRHFYLTRFIEALHVEKSEIMYNPYIYYGNNPVFIRNQKHFINHFTMFLKSHKIKYDIITATKRYNGPITDLLLEENVDVLLRVNLKEPVYIDFFGVHTNINQYSPLLENSKAYALIINDRNKITEIKNTTLPVSNYNDNNSLTVSDISINDDFDIVSVKRKTSLKGHLKENSQKDLMYYYDYVNEDYKKYKTKSFIGHIKKKKDIAKYGNELNSLVEKLKTKQAENFKNETNKEYRFDISNHTYDITNTGRYNFSDAFVYNESFDVEKDLVKKAGRNYILEVGKLIGGQVEISEKEKIRDNNIYMNYPKSFNNNINLTIPEGYTIAGLDKLNTNISNETGGFTSTATVNDNILSIKVSKYYTHNFEPKENWSKMVEFLDVAYQFTQEKILLKKI